MRNEEMLQDIYNENRAVNRNLQRISTLGMVALISNIMREAKEKGDDSILKIGKIVLYALAVSQVLLLIGDFVDLKKAKNNCKSTDYKS